MKYHVEGPLYADGWYCVEVNLTTRRWFKTRAPARAYAAELNGRDRIRYAVGVRRRWIKPTFIWTRYGWSRRRGHWRRMQVRQ